MIADLYHPASEIEWVSVSVTAASPVQVKATSTKCRGVLVGGAAVAGIYVGDVTTQILMLISPIGAIVFIPIDDASKIYLDVSLGTVDIGCGIVK
jgi:hypothetical protein